MIDVFTREQFEAALPVRKQASISPIIPAPIETKLWKSFGLVGGEYTYSVPVKDPFHIIVRSSVREDGQSAGAGEDSIRCWISRIGAEHNDKPWGSKLGKYITRMPGWQARLTETLRGLYKMALLIDKCPDCGEYRKIYRVKKKTSEYYGRLFLKCGACAEHHNHVPMKFLEV